ncbi:hypothetical protein ILUMI_05544 [Ignelater luminosus]|uniref:Uncharacterized protein n=1 Tax=Ignelater luminosus TaxID=2038154 RepID=A0A8K0DAW3_IGNLU|nr:hypothetical protein ILUMI_05544 [Ignelater luminosus]
MAVSKAAYCSKWYLNCFASSKTPLLLMIQNSQREIITTAGGLIIFNATTVLTVLKVAWSACTLIRGLK